MSAAGIRVLSFNCWGLKYVAKNRQERIRAIAEELSASHYDLIGLQELWVYADYELIRTKLAHNLPFSKFFHSGALGAGLALFSRFPILSTSIHPYSLNGSPLDVAGGDWFVGKAAASIVVEHPTLGELEIFNTHMYAKGGEKGPEERRAHRLANAWELANLIRTSARLGRYIIAVGDFNSIPTTLPMAILREHACLADAWSQSHHDSPPSPRAVLSPQHALRDYGVTADSPLNSYSADKPLDGDTRRQQGKRLDYILFRAPATREADTAPRPALTAVEAKVVLTRTVPGYDFSFSDHFGVEATLRISQEVGPPHHVEAGVPSPVAPPLRELCLSPLALNTTLQALTARYRTCRSEAHFQLMLFVGCVGVLLVMILSSAWLPSAWINPLFIFFTVFVSWLGTTMLYSGFIFGNWELNALANIIEDLEFIKERGPGARRCETALVNPT